jgi:hypothetical protein
MTIMDRTHQSDKDITGGDAAGIDADRLKTLFFASAQQLAAGGFQDFIYRPGQGLFVVHRSLSVIYPAQGIRLKAQG